MRNEIGYLKTVLIVMVSALLLTPHVQADQCVAVSNVVELEDGELRFHPSGPKFVYFGFDRDELSPLAREDLTHLAYHLTDASPDSHIRLCGHTDTKGDADYNMALSQRRAENVAKFLIDLGVKSSQIEVYWYGEADTLVPTDDGVREPNNRRVETSIYGG